MRSLALFMGFAYGLLPELSVPCRRNVGLFAAKELGEYETRVAKSTVAMIRDLVSERPDLVEKIDEIATLLETSGSARVATNVAETKSSSLKEMVLKATRQTKGTSEQAAVVPAARNVLSTARNTQPPEDEIGEYVAYRSPDLDYTIWLNKKDPTNSYYEYHKN